MLYTVINLERSYHLLSFAKPNNFGYTYDVNNCLKLSEKEALELKDNFGTLFIDNVESGKEMIELMKDNGPTFKELQNMKSMVIPLSVFDEFDKMEVVPLMEYMIL